ncbi:alpha/beta hydrolase [Paludicola sp. MB14-C6]|uniref:alpha/beta hydrolase n=1 Tax=Paludihabitans sp. MB14-C6 TaxID=3070656 RepID=UPI0027DD2130|nr:alpha/beta hydrolase [Paludicola sp. MB14-C6]WMJ21936.1 alpha/beta hydrolase [Paludicola sp. MB14-C6]
MIYKEENINIDYEGYGLEAPPQKATIQSYIVDSTDQTYLNRKRPAVIICVGGGYEKVVSEKAEPIALQFCASGFHAFVLNYSVTPVRFPGALLELSKAVATIRASASKYNIHEDKIVICGFSAGGHLAASLGVYWKQGFIQRYLGYDNDENQPNALILGYPVISNKEGIAHLRSMQNLLGKYPDQKELELFSLEDNVNDLVPPTFLWHTSDDPIVPVDNSLLFASALRKHEIPFELHVYPSGDHGLGLANELTASFLGQINPACQNWIDMAIRFINNL